MLSEKAIQEFRDIYKAEFGVDLSLAEATEKDYNLIGLYKVVLRKESPSSKEGRDG